MVSSDSQTVGERENFGLRRGWDEGITRVCDAIEEEHGMTDSPKDMTRLAAKNSQENAIA